MSNASSVASSLTELAVSGPTGGCNYVYPSPGSVIRMVGTTPRREWSRLGDIVPANMVVHVHDRMPNSGGAPSGGPARSGADPNE